MGIPNLISLLSTVTRPEYTIYSRHDETKTAVIIDGSALAYYIHYQVVKRAKQSAERGIITNSIVCFDYNTYSELLLRFLSSLESCGLVIKNIFIDGHLPPVKTETRVQRIQNSINSLDLLHSLNGKNIEIPAHSGSYPPAAFLVLALTSTLYKSLRYKSLLSTIPGEADTFCADRAHNLEKTEKCIILTSDSDLLLFEFGSNVDIGLLNSISFQSVEEEEDFHATIALWSPFKIRQTVFPDTKHTMVDFAWTLLQDPYHTLKSMVSRTKLLAPTYIEDQEFQAFRNQYQLSQPNLLSSPVNETRFDCIKYLDSRITEVVLESPYFSTLKVTVPTVTSPQSIHMYLPILFEDTSRESAWVVSQEWRLFAYYLLFPKDTIITERYRKGKRVGETKCIVPITLPDILDEVLIHNNASSPSRKMGAATSWLELVTMSIAREYIDKSATPLSKSQILSLIDALSIIFPTIEKVSQGTSTNRTSHTTPPPTQSTSTSNSTQTTWSWFTVHLFAQLQGYLYSLHMLREVASLCCRRASMKITEDMALVSLCNRILELVPDLSNFPSNVPLTGARLNRKVSKMESLPVELYSTAKSILADVEQYRRKQIERMQEEEDGNDDGSEEYMGMMIG